MLCPLHRQQNFYPRSPCGERLCILHHLQRLRCISIHALLAESDSPSTFFYIVLQNFYPRSPCGERPSPSTFFYIVLQNFYPRSPCGERPVVDNIVFVPGKFLSTLSLRRATPPAPPRREFYKISIHALLAESDHAPNHSPCPHNNFYPRSPCGERPPPAPQGKSSIKFLSTLSLRRATPMQKNSASATLFLSTLSLRRATLD